MAGWSTKTAVSSLPEAGPRTKELPGLHQAVGHRRRAQDVLEIYQRIGFPHQSTADQWFNEASSRATASWACTSASRHSSRYQHDDVGVGHLQVLFERLYRYWYPPSLAINERSSAHATEYSRIMEIVRTEGPLRGLDHTMFAALPIPAEPVAARDEFYVCNELLQLIENVYVDLELEHNWSHPHVEGWMEVFKRWARQPSFRRTWKIAESTYGERFRNFYNDRLCGRPLGLPRAFVASRGGLNGGDAAAALKAFDKAILAGAAARARHQHDEGVWLSTAERNCSSSRLPRELQGGSARAPPEGAGRETEVSRRCTRRVVRARPRPDVPRSTHDEKGARESSGGSAPRPPRRKPHRLRQSLQRVSGDRRGFLAPEKPSSSQRGCIARPTFAVAVGQWMPADVPEPWNVAGWSPTTAPR
jgi:hypothetical protein